jgi:hypothetical protein
MHVVGSSGADDGSFVLSSFSAAFLGPVATGEPVQGGGQGTVVIGMALG